MMHIPSSPDYQKLSLWQKFSRLSGMIKFLAVFNLLLLLPQGFNLYAALIVPERKTITFVMIGVVSAVNSMGFLFVLWSSLRNQRAKFWLEHIVRCHDEIKEIIDSTPPWTHLKLSRLVHLYGLMNFTIPDAVYESIVEQINDANTANTLQVLTAEQQEVVKSGAAKIKDKYPWLKNNKQHNEPNEIFENAKKSILVSNTSEHEMALIWLQQHLNQPGMVGVPGDAPYMPVPANNEAVMPAELAMGEIADLPDGFFVAATLPTLPDAAANAAANAAAAGIILYPDEWYGHLNHGE